MNKSDYYAEMQRLAQIKRKEHGITTSKINIPVIKKIYKKEGIKIDQIKLSSKIRAAYFCDGDDCSVLLNKTLPREPKLFSLLHELKHHFVDRDTIENGGIQCGDYNANELIEIGAEVFAAEFIFPEKEMLSLLESLGIDKQNCTSKSVVKIKRTKTAPISYMFIVKRLERFKFIQPGAFSGIKFQNLEEKIHGIPFYKKAWLKKKGKMKLSSK